ncbi:MAG: T9SS type A sorting domain-containing protein [Bacteroidetes bacterium]|nr:T9SS type A sorting domain-containing protein [Bacteroidota bacterium]
MRLKIIICLAVFVVCCEGAVSQSVTWEKLYSNGAIFRGIQTSDGGYVAVGTTRLQNQFKIIVIRTNSVGETLWNKTFGSLSNGFSANWIEESYDNGFVIAGNDGGGIAGDAYLLNIDSSGIYSWSRSFGGNELEEALKVLKTSDSGYIIGARSNQNLLVIKTDNSGNMQWQKMYTSNGFGDLVKVDNFGYLLMGISGGNKLFRLNNNGDTLWSKSAVGNSIGESLRRLTDGSLIIGGTTVPNECVVTKTDSIGNIQWEIQYPGVGREFLYDLEILPNNRGFLISGVTDSLGNDYFQAFIRVIDPVGNVKFKKYYTPSFYPTDYAEFRSGIPTSDGGFYLSGSIAPISTGIAYMVKTDSNGNFIPVGISISESILIDNFKLYQNYPNPFNSSTNIIFELNENAIVDLKIYDILGNEINNIIENKKINSGR